MALYKERFFSLVKFAKQCSLEVSSKLNIEPPIFVNMDAHAQIDSVPNQDFIGIGGYSLHLADKLPEVFVVFLVSTWEDPDLVLHHDLMDFMLNKLAPENKINVFSSIDPMNPIGSMVIANNVIVDQVAKDVSRSVQMIHVRLLSVVLPQ